MASHIRIGFVLALYCHTRTVLHGQSYPYWVCIGFVLSYQGSITWPVISVLGLYWLCIVIPGQYSMAGQIHIWFVLGLCCHARTVKHGQSDEYWVCIGFVLGLCCHARAVKHDQSHAYLVCIGFVLVCIGFAMPGQYSTTSQMSIGFGLALYRLCIGCVLPCHAL